MLNKAMMASLSRRDVRVNITMHDGFISCLATNAFTRGAKLCFPIFNMAMGDFYLAKGAWPNAPPKYACKSACIYMLIVAVRCIF